MGRNAKDPLAKLLRKKALKVWLATSIFGSYFMLIMYGALLGPDADLRMKALFGFFAVGYVVLWGWGLVTLCVPTKNRSYRRIAQVSPTAVSEVNAVLAGQASAFEAKNLTISPYWLVHKSRFGVTAVRSTDVVWLYRKVQSTSVNLVHVKQDHSIFFATATKRVEAVMKRHWIDDVIAAAFTLCPNAYVGFDEQLRKQYDRKKKRPQALASLAAGAARQRAPKTDLFSFLPSYDSIPQEQHRGSWI